LQCLHVYLLRALHAMYDHLRNGTPLPRSQVVHTVPRGGSAGLAPAITASSVPAIASAPAAGDAISCTGATINVPD
jgi:hydroxybutyrate-dimer hydrolase